MRKSEKGREVKNCKRKRGKVESGDVEMRDRERKKNGEKRIDG